MGKVMKADASVADAYVEIDLGSDQAGVWVTLDLAFAADTLALPLTGIFLQLWNAAHDTEADHADSGNDGAQYWETFTVLDYVPAPVAETFETVELHLVDGGATALYVDGTLVGAGTDGVGVDVRFVTVGFILNAPADATSIFFFDNVKVGTTRGASNLFADDFEGGDLSNWTSTSGSVSVIDDPYSTVPGAGVKIAFGYAPFAASPVFVAI